MISRPFCPLVVGAPRSGFTLLSSVLVHLAPLAPSKGKGDLRQAALDSLADTLGWSVSDAVVEEIAALGLAEDLVYNRNFRELTGGPKWIDPLNIERACFRKYIGFRGGGDLSLIMSHPRQTLDHDTVVHSHVDPGLWLNHPGYAAYQKFSSIRNPIGIINSSIFSLNALASEYIQKFLPPEQDQDELRQHQAFYKMTDLNFFAGLASHLKRYLEAFLKVRSGYIIMRWEDLISHPVSTIQAVGEAAGFTVSDDHATAIWAQLDHRNLTGAHKHNYRRGFGIIGNWREWLTNHHLKLLREMGLGPLIAALGYYPDEVLDESAYTPFQREVDGMIARGIVYDDYADRDLFTFAFNKSNIDIEKFQFRRYSWRAHTQIERSCFVNPDLELRIWDVAETAAGRLNQFLDDLLAGDFGTPQSARASVESTFARHQADLGRFAPTRFADARAVCLAAIEPHAAPAPAVLPRLLKTVGVHNIVQYGPRFFGLPQALGPIDLTQDDVTGRAGVVIDKDLASVERQIMELSGAAHG
jgi:hypothetical protein